METLVFDILMSWNGLATATNKYCDFIQRSCVVGRILPEFDLVRAITKLIIVFL